MFKDPLESKSEIFPHIYINKAFDFFPNRPTLPVVSGVSGSGKDFVVDRLKNDGYFKHLKTATTRARRYKLTDVTREKEVLEAINNAKTRETHEAMLSSLESDGIVTTEHISAYVWMRFPKSLEEMDNLQLYYSNLREEYSLVESDAHLGNFYGLPKASIASLLDAESFNQLPFSVIRTDFSGMRTITNMFSEEFNILNLAILPDSAEQAVNAVIERQSNISQGELDSRIKEYQLASEVYSEYANYYVKNTRADVNGEPGIDITARSLEELLRDIHHRN